MLGKNLSTRPALEEQDQLDHLEGLQNATFEEIGLGIDANGSRGRIRSMYPVAQHLINSLSVMHGGAPCGR